LVAVGAASNATGGINPIERICDMAHRVGAQVFVDAVHYGPHGRINVADWDCDYVTCSAYKFFGPHLGILWGRRDSMESLPAYKVRPASNELPDKWMTGTQSHEAIAGGLAAIDYLADLGRQLAGDPSLERPTALDECFQLITRYEQTLSAQLIEGLLQIPGIKIYGIDDLRRLGERFPTVSITHSGIPTPKLATWLAGEGINVWHGNYYALEFTESLNLEPDGMVRIGLVHYNTPAETERLLSALELCASTAAATN
jgi:selenocysteine lyase/cysteine desulfurase